MKGSKCILSLFLLLGTSADLANSFQLLPKQTSAFLRVESSSSSSKPQPSVLPSNKADRWNARNDFAALRMSSEGDVGANVEIEEESPDSAKKELPETTAAETDAVSVTDASENDESESETEPSEVVATEATDEAPAAAFFANPPESAKEVETVVASEESEKSSAAGAESVAFFASKPESTNGDGNGEAQELVEESATSPTAEASGDVAPETAEMEADESTKETTENMSVDDILAVAEEMKEVTQSLPDPPKEPIISLDAIKKASRKGIEFINSPPRPPAPKTEDDEKIDAFVQALGAAAKGTSKEIAQSILGNLRRAAANALTESLPDDDRAKLLERMKVDEEEEEEEEEEDDEEEIRASIAEEIAAAKAEEARRSEELWAAEKESLIKQMEEAANARVENELAIQKERLLNEMKAVEASLIESNVQLEDEKIKLEQQLADMDKRVEEIKVGIAEVDELEGILQKREQQQAELAKVEDDLRVRVEEIEEQKKLIAEKTEELQTAEAEAAQAEEAADEAEETSDVDTPADEPVSAHPVLGEMVSDLGYKRIYLTSAETLGTLPIWKKQRIFRQSRARTMALDKAKNMENGFPGAICLAEDSEGNLSVLDGQHRIGMMQLLQEMQDKEDVAIPSDKKAYFDKILVEVFPNLNAVVDDDKHAESVFLEINKAEPVKLVDMPGIASARDSKIITQAVQRLEEQFPQMFSASQKCRVPNVNVDNLRNNIFGANIMKRHKLRSGKQLYDWLLVQNAAVGASYELDAGRREAISDSAWQKASENAFYLGLESSWLYM